jgi:hypothetical protein
VICGEADYFSFADAGFLQDWLQGSAHPQLVSFRSSSPPTLVSNRRGTAISTYLLAPSPVKWDPRSFSPLDRLIGCFLEARISTLCQFASARYPVECRVFSYPRPHISR